MYGITSYGSISSLGTDTDAAEAYLNPASAISYRNGSPCNLPCTLPCAALSDPAESLVEELRSESSAYARLDRSAILAIVAARRAYAGRVWEGYQTLFSIGSSRGATSLLEKNHERFLTKNRTSAFASPSTTGGNISSAVMQDLGLKGCALSSSQTCSSTFAAIANGLAWLRSGMCEKALVGGSEAPLTPFTVGQLEALRIYTKERSDLYPCRPCSADRNGNSFVLGEGAALFCLEEIAPPTSYLARIDAIGFGAEELTSPTSLSDDGRSFQLAMRAALNELSDDKPVDLVILHAPGTLHGDTAELEAVQAVFGEEMPTLSNNKWKIGHCLGASGALSLEFALLLLSSENTPRTVPYPNLLTDFSNKRNGIERIMINAAGFGGNAFSLIVSKER